MHYVNNEILSQSLSRWVVAVRQADASGVERPGVPEEVGQAVLQIAQGVIAKRATFRRHPLREDMRSHAVLVALGVLDKFDPDATNPFAWLTTTVHRACLRFLTIEDVNRYHELCYVRAAHPDDAQVRTLFADERTRDAMAHHEERLATAREATRASRAATPKGRKKDITLPDGERISILQLSKRLGVGYARVYARLKAGRTVQQILDEFGPVTSGSS